MSSDIRSFFGGKGSQGVEKGRETQAPSKNAPAAKPKGRAKRKVVSDSEEEAQELVPKKATPKIAAPKKQPKQESPVGEVTTTSDYFASSKKRKATQSTPTKGKVVVPSQNPSPAKDIPKSKPTPTRDVTRVSSRKKARPTYVDLADNVDDTPAIDVDEESGEDIYGAEYKRSGKKMEDEYQSDDDEEDEIKPIRKGNRKAAQTVSKRAKKEDSDSDIDMKDAASTNGFVVYDEEDAKESRPINREKIDRSRKRKSVELEEEDEDDEDIDERASKRVNSTKTAGVKKPPPKKPTPKKPRAKKEDVPESKEMQEIIDNIPLIRAPTPPPRDTENKFDFRSNAQRSQPAPGAGSKETPTGADNCLAGLNFVFTGLLDALSRDDGIELVKRYGGKVTTAPSGKTNFVVLGNEAGPKKLETIAKHNLKTINEDGLFALIRTLPANGGGSKAAEKFEKEQRLQDQKIKDAAKEIEKEERMNGIAGNKAIGAGKSAKSGEGSNSNKVDSRLWTVKYAPTATSQICGNKIQVEKLQTWLRAWRDNARTKFKKAGKDGSGVFRAVMIHGAPGIGKTTAAHLAAKLESYDIVESNASDTRSKKLVETGLKGVLDTTSLRGYFAGDGKKVDVEKKKLVLIMDEVDGMSAGDRGGVGALAAVCKKTNVPMILICNDRKLPKMKPFDHVTYDLPFRKPTTEQVRTRIMTILYREGMKDMIPGKVVDALIEGSRADIRQIINMISTAKVDQQTMDFDSGKKMTNAWEKHIILKPWDIVNKILAGGMFAQSSNSTLNEKIELYFNDHELSSLMLQENYLGTTPILSGSYSGKERNLKNLELAEKASESISDGDLVDRMIHGSQQQWSLMPTHAVFSFVRPASYVSGTFAGHGSTRFPAWLGNNSKQGKLLRFVKEIQGHMRLRSSGDRHEIRQQYLPLLWYRLIRELNENGKEVLEDVIGLMDSYFLTKDDWDAILELGVGPMSMDSIKLDTQTKTAFTKTYNQQSHPMPFMKASSVVAPKKQARERPDLEEAMEDSDELEEVVEVEGEDEDEALDLKKDKYVRAPKKKAAPKKGPAKKGLGKSKGKVKDESGEEDGIENDESEEDVKPQKAKGRGKASGATRGRGKGKK